MFAWLVRLWQRMEKWVHPEKESPADAAIVPICTAAIAETLCSGPLLRVAALLRFSPMRQRGGCVGSRATPTLTHGATCLPPPRAGTPRVRLQPAVRLPNTAPWSDAGSETRPSLGGRNRAPYASLQPARVRPRAWRKSCTRGRCLPAPAPDTRVSADPSGSPDARPTRAPFSLPAKLLPGRPSPQVWPPSAGAPSISCAGRTGLPCARAPRCRRLSPDQARLSPRRVGQGHSERRCDSCRAWRDFA